MSETVKVKSTGKTGCVDVYVGNGVYIVTLEDGSTEFFDEEELEFLNFDPYPNQNYNIIQKLILLIKEMKPFESMNINNEEFIKYICSTVGMGRVKYHKIMGMDDRIDIEKIFQSLNPGDLVKITKYDGASGPAKVISIDNDVLTVEFVKDETATCYECSSIVDYTHRMMLTEVCELKLVQKAEITLTSNVTYIECEKQPQKIKEYEFTPREMAEKILEFNRDFSTDSCDGEEERKKELEVVTELFDKLQKSDEFNILALHLDLMFMDSAFD